MMAATEQEILNVLQWLENTKLISVNAEWLEACISWLKSRGTAHGNLSMELKNGVYEQWLMSDLDESGNNCLPDQISNLPKTFIEKVIALQINSVVDIGKSAYSQMKKLKKEDNEDVNVDENKNKQWEPKPCRMLKLELTDGDKTIEGMEYRPMRKLCADLKPGTKILINAGTLCRSGMMFLTDDNVKILGGQVKHLIEENSQLNILNRLVLNAKGGEDGGDLDEGFSNNASSRQSHSNSNGSNRNNPSQGQEAMIQQNCDDFEDFWNDTDEFLAELDLNVNMNVNGPATSTQVQKSEVFHISDDDIPEDALNEVWQLDDDDDDFI